LIIAAYHGHAQIVRLLLQYKADPTLKDSFGKCAIERTRDRKIIKILEDAENNKPMTTSILKRPSNKNKMFTVSKYEQVSRIMGTVHQQLICTQT